MAITLDGMKIDLPTTWTEELMREGLTTSAVGALKPPRPVRISGEILPISLGGFRVGYVGEGGRKPVGDLGFDVAKLIPRKFAGILPVSREAARIGGAGLVQEIRDNMVSAVAEQTDLGIFHGLSAFSGQLIPEVPYLDQTTNLVRFDGTGTTAEIASGVLEGYDLAAETRDPTGFAFDSRVRTSLIRVNAQSGLADNVVPNLDSTFARSFAGLPAAYSRSVSGRGILAEDTGVRGYVGAWDRLRWGFSSNIELTRSDEGTLILPSGEMISAFQDNMTFFRIEFELAWWMSPDDFAAYVLDPEAVPEDPEP